jgi:hypothetical protein
MLQNHSPYRRHEGERHILSCTLTIGHCLESRQIWVSRRLESARDRHEPKLKSFQDVQWRHPTTPNTGVSRSQRDMSTYECGLPRTAPQFQHVLQGTRLSTQSLTKALPRLSIASDSHIAAFPEHELTVFPFQMLSWQYVGSLISKERVMKQRSVRSGACSTHEEYENTCRASAGKLECRDQNLRTADVDGGWWACFLKITILSCRLD